MENKVKEQVCNKTKLSPSPQDCFPENFKIDGNLASKLFKKHKKSTFICKSLYKLTDCATVYRPCVQLFCRVKGFIPVKENHFPKHINNVETDILEGESVLAGQLRVGEQIQSSHYSGTLGGFVKILGEITFLTCAHVVLHKDNLCGIKLSIPDDQPIYMDCVQDSSNGQNIFRCGKLRHIEFRTDRPGETSIDAALIKLGKGIYIDENDFLANGEGNKHSVSSLGMSSPFLNENFVDYQKLFRGRHFRQFENVCIGAKSRLTVNKSKIDEMEDKDEGVNIDLENIVDTFNDVVKSENTNIAGPSTFSCTNQVVYDEAHIQQTRLMRVDNERTRRRLSRCMYNQIAITNIPFQKGDSGTCIYVHDSTLNVGGCIGMAIANNPGRDGGVVVTPMKEILKTFHVKIQ